MVDLNKELSLPPPGLALPHHSLASWNINASAWYITNLKYVSPPSCFTLYGYPVASGWMLCKASGTTHLPEGRLVTQFYKDPYGAGFLPMFRNTAAIGTANQNNCYRASMAPNSTTFQITEFLAGSNIRSWTGTKTNHGTNTWVKYRLSWALLGWDLTVRLEYWNGSAWVQQGDLITIITPLFGAEAIQRVGYYFSNINWSDWNCIDDTEIWEKA